MLIVNVGKFNWRCVFWLDGLKDLFPRPYNPRRAEWPLAMLFYSKTL